MNKKTAILGIDLQNDFTSPQGSLYVKGAREDMIRSIRFINQHRNEIDYIALTLDSHQPVHIAHQCYWKGEAGNHPPLFTAITLDGVKNGTWIPQYNADTALAYFEQLAQKGDTCIIWPMHCILGTNGWALNKDLCQSLSDWAIETGKAYELFYKGYAQNTEHYSIFRAAVEFDKQPETKLNVSLLDTLDAYDELILLGQAADFCVASSLKDIINERPALAKKAVVFTDCMSWINPDNQTAGDIFLKAEELGVRFEKSTNYSF